MKERQEKVKNHYDSLSKRRKASLLQVNLSSCYIQKKPKKEETVNIMNEIKDIYTIHPFKGYRRICMDLQDLGYAINHKKVYRLMNLMNLQAIYPKKNLSKKRQQDAVYPYLLKDYPPQNPHDVWCVDITYIKTSKGFVYLTALIDVVSRFVMGFNISTCLDTESCLLALEMAINSGYKPKIINSDQGCQFTSQEWAYALSLLQIKVSMDGKGRCLDNIPIERFWRSIKYEEVYLKTYDSVHDAKQGISTYIQWYNYERRHTGINKHKPYEVMTGKKNALKWAFSKAGGYVDNYKKLPHIPTASTARTKSQINMKKKVNLSLQMTA